MKTLRLLCLGGMLVFPVYLGLFWSTMNFSRTPFQQILVVRKVLDGDTFTGQIAGEKSQTLHVFRLAYIDAPEKDQLSLDGKPIGQHSHKALERKLAHGQVYIKLLGRDIYQRLLAEVFIESSDQSLQNLNLWMVEQGQALLWNWAHFSSKKQKRNYQSVSILAYKQGKGMFQYLGLVAPVHYRRQQKAR